VRVLLVEDEVPLAEMVRRGLAAEGHSVEVVHDGVSGLAAASTGQHDVVVLDIMLPGLSGYRILQRLRAAEIWTPVLMLTAKDGEYDEADAFDLGADDYLVKPFSFVVLLARLRALLRRVETPSQRLAFADLTLDPSSRDVLRGERRIELTRTEHTLLELFLQHPRQVLTRSQIFERVWGYDFGATSNALGVYVGYLRRKTEAGGETRLLHTVRGIGYVLREEP
jgi:two-component system, OmpR family, response regulator